MSNEENKLKFESLVRKIRRDGADIDGFLSMLESSDFYSAPATTQFHWSFEGGLCEHTMDVYDQLVKQVSMHHGSVENSPYSQDTLILVAISHDLYKINFYNKYVKNEKVYSPIGKKSDEMGRFDWVSSSAYKIADANKRFVLGTAEENSLYIAQGFFPLSVEESSAILNNKTYKDSADSGQMISFEKYPLSLYLYVSDMISTFLHGNEPGQNNPYLVNL